MPGHVFLVIPGGKGRPNTKTDVIDHGWEKND